VDMDSTIGKKNKEIERLADAVNRHQ